jgi:hypothetical protein
MKKVIPGNHFKAFGHTEQKRIRSGFLTRLTFVLLILPAIMIFADLSYGQTTSIHSHSATTATADETQKAYLKLKALGGNWEGPVTTAPAQAAMVGKVAQLSFRATSSGNAMMHDLTIGGLKDNPLTMFYVDDARFLLTHYCDAGNRPRMVGTMSTDGKTLDFDFIDITGPLKYGHMHHAKFTFIDDNHHIEEWTFMLPGDKTARATFDLRRKK